MFNTSIKDVEDPERLTRTACHTEQRKFRVSFKKAAEKDCWAGNHSTLRPLTSPIGQEKADDTLNSTGKSLNLVDMRTIDVMENNLQSQYREEMGSYLRRKLRNMVGKRQQDVLLHRYLNNTIDIGELQNISHSTAPLDQFYTIYNQKSRVKVSKGVEQAYVTNTKQHIVRLIQRKREQQEDFQQLSKSIKIKRQKKDQKRHRSLKDHFKVPSIQNQGWDNNWRASISQEKSRYRDRLMMKCKRDNGGLWLVNFDK